MTVERKGKLTAKKNKNAKDKDKPHMLGPFPVNIDASFEELLVLIAEESRVSRNCLVVTGLTWKHMKPANAPSLPLMNENSFKLMVSELRGKLTKKNTSVIVSLTMP